MKKSLIVVCALFLGQLAFAQVGTGVVILTTQDLTFTSTNVDSSNVVNIEVVNSVGIEQTIFFGGLDAPFSMDDASPQVVAATDTTSIGLIFSPTAVGSYTDTLEVVGSIFGSADLVVHAEGIQVILEWLPNDIAFETTAIGQSDLQFLSLTSAGNGAAEITEAVFSNPVFGIDSAQSTFSIPEGVTADLALTFNPINAGTLNETLTLTTNDPNNPVIVVPLEGTGISEVSGAMCDITWSAANSPYTLVGDVLVPMGCTLTIEEGVEVDLNGFRMNVGGEFVCVGTAMAPVSITGGVLSFEDGAPLHIQYLLFDESEDFNSPYELLYYNNFESSSMEYDFDCYDVQSQVYVEDNSTSYQWGCSNFYRTSSSSWSEQEFEGDYYFYWYSTDYDGYLYLDEPLVATEGGVYEVSFRYESDRYERDCQMRMDFWQNGAWETAYESPYDIESNSEFARFAKAEISLEPGDTLNFRIYHDIGSTSSDRDQMYTYLDDMRVDRKRVRKNEVKWDLTQNQSDFDALEASWGDEFDMDGETLSIHAEDGTINFTTDSWTEAPIIVPETGWYFIEIENRTPKADFNCYHYTRYKNTNPNNTWYYVIENRQRYSSSDGAYTYDWRPETIRAYNYFEAGSRIDFEFYNYVYSSGPNDDEMDWEGRNFVIYQLEETGAPDFTAPHVSANRPMILEQVTAGSVLATDALTSIGSSIDQVYLEAADNNFEASANSVFEYVWAEGASNTLDIQDSEMASLRCTGDATCTLARSTVRNSSRTGLEFSGATTDLVVEHSLIQGHAEMGIDLSSANGSLSITNAVISDNGSYGIQSDVSGVLDYVTIANNANVGWEGGSTYNKWISNSIFFQNGTTLDNDTPYDGANFAPSFLYTDTEPNFADADYRLEPFSICVDAAMPWETDQHMPEGLGGTRADLGAYGGPANGGWGGNPTPSGAVVLEAIADTPQDQGNSVGLTFSGSFFDAPTVQNGVSEYEIWRHFSPDGQAIATLSEGDWEYVGELNALGFDGYAFQATTLGNTNDDGTFNSCFTVVARTANENTYWYSNVLCGEAVDNLAPEAPEMFGQMLAADVAELSWELPAEMDYAYTEVFNGSGFQAVVSADTLTTDTGAGADLTYFAVHFDVNGNASDTSTVTLQPLALGFDEIPLVAGWNLISSDRFPAQTDVATLFADLNPGNLEYVTGFDNGALFFDPNGLAFLNTLNTWQEGAGYWVKVAAADTLYVDGNSLAADFIPTLNNGWNLIGYPNQAPQAPEAFFANLIADGSLEYATGFDQGSQFFDPNGLPFLNTLTLLRNNFGFWVKMAPQSGVVAQTATDMLQSPTPAFLILNGTSNLEAYVGEQVQVVSAEGQTVGSLNILPGGYLMTAAIYGDDPQTETLEGAAMGSELSLVFRGETAEQKVVWNGGLDVRNLDLTFDRIGPVLHLNQNPVTGPTLIQLNLNQAAHVQLEVRDAMGRLVEVLANTTMTAGNQPVQWNANLSEGSYTLQLLLDGQPVETLQVIKTH